jgi:hypothetical protein
MADKGQLRLEGTSDSFRIVKFLTGCYHNQREHLRETSRGDNSVKHMANPTSLTARARPSRDVVWYHSEEPNAIVFIASEHRHRI